MTKKTAKTMNEFCPIFSREQIEKHRIIRATRRRERVAVLVLQATSSHELTRNK